MTPMTAKPQLVEEQSGENDFIDEIARLLPAEQRPLWYRDMAHLRRLPADDEILRIARAMGFLAIVTRQTPAQITTEREKLATILDQSIKAIQSARQDMIALHKRLEERLAQLPAQVAEGINAEAIAATLSESLRQRFRESGIAETSQSLTLVAKEAKQVAAEFDRSSKQLAISYRVAAEDARKSLDDMRLTIQTATTTAKRCASELTQTFLREYKWSVLVLCSAALAVGFSLGIFYYRWVNSNPAEPAPNKITAPVPQNTTPSQPASRPRKAQRKVQSEGQVSQ